MERVMGNGARLGLGRPDIWAFYALSGLKWLLFGAALWLVLVPLQVCLQCTVGGGGWATALLIAVIATLLLGFLWVDRVLIKKRRRVSVESFSRERAFAPRPAQ